MKKYYFTSFLLLVLLFGVVVSGRFSQKLITSAPPYGESEPLLTTQELTSGWHNWKRPEGPAKVALQVGHWKNNEFPEELSRLRGNTGASSAGYTEAEVNLKIAELTAQKLRERGVRVEILPATVPPEYWADVFVAIHADGNLDSDVNGFKIAAPWRDLTGKADEVVLAIEESYKNSTELSIDPNISRNMRGYYAFAWWRYEHTVHPMTTSVIVETGFLTSPDDRKVIVQTPELSAVGIAEGILKYLEAEKLIG